MAPLATIIVPTHDHGPTLRYSVGSALAQTVRDIEIFIIGDGMPEEAAAAAREVAAGDARIRLLERPKGQRHGEAYRHEVLISEAAGRYVFYLADDDMWLPEHVETLAGLLDAEEADFANALTVARLGDGAWAKRCIDLTIAHHREAMLGGFNLVGLTVSAHRLDSYRRLPRGWQAAPSGTPTDLHMWQQWLSEPWVRYVSSGAPTSMNFPSPERTGQTPEQRLEELGEHWPVLGDPAARASWLQRVIADDFPRSAWLESHWPQLEGSLEEHEAALDWHQTRNEELRAGHGWLVDALERERGDHERCLADLAHARAERDELRSRLDAVTASLTWRAGEAVRHNRIVGRPIRAVAAALRRRGHLPRR